jgi:predicted nucleic acid-binding protein
MKRVFVDTSVFFSACYSQTGASFEIFRLALNGVIELVTSEYILEETRRNLVGKSPEDLPRFLGFLDLIDFESVNPSREEVLKAAGYTELKDAPVVAAARQAEVDFLVSLDRRHLVGRSLVAQQSGVSIVLPETLLNIIRAD